jgi:hypothetical protein
MVINSPSTALPRARGTLLIHACTRAMTAPLEWVLATVLEHPVSLDWMAQPIAPSMLRASFEWSGVVGQAERIVSGVRGIPNVRFEVTQMSPTPGFDQRWSYAPSLGVFRSDIDVHGNIMVNELRIRHAMESNSTDATALMTALDQSLGTAWDAELEPFRIASDGDSVRWVNQVG